jgi:hypothetical protein
MVNRRGIMKTFILEVVLPASAAIGLLLGLAAPSARAGVPAPAVVQVAVEAAGESGIERRCERLEWHGPFTASRCH